MRRVQRINDFLRLIAEISKNGIEIDSNLVYANLITLGTNKKLIENYFTNWENEFTNNPNISVFVKKDWEYFCQFVGGNMDSDQDKELKIYIPLDETHIYHGVNTIFNYLSKSNISHKSRVSKHTRFDDIVIRVDDFKSLETIREFVEKDEYIREGLTEINPFAISDGIISFVWDSTNSYDSVVSEWVSEYINSMRDNLDCVSYNSFFEYVKRRYNEVFQQGKGINSFYQNREISNNASDLLTYQRITELLMISLRKESKLSDLYKFYQFAKDSSNKEETYKNIKRLQNKDSLCIEEIPSDLKEAFDYAFLEISKMECPEIAVKRFKMFSKEGNYNLFTKTNNVRPLMKKMLTIPYAERLIYDEEKQALINASLYTLIKYDTIQLGRALFGVENGDYNGFTNDDNVRDKLKLWIEPKEIKEVVHKVLQEEGYEDLKPNEEYWVFMEMMSKLIDKTK